MARSIDAGHIVINWTQVSQTADNTVLTMTSDVFAEPDMTSNRSHPPLRRVGLAGYRRAAVIDGDIQPAVQEPGPRFPCVFRGTLRYSEAFCCHPRDITVDRRCCWP